eukprot:5565185-Amphidinium_carterae.1
MSLLLPAFSKFATIIEFERCRASRLAGTFRRTARTSAVMTSLHADIVGRVIATYCLEASFV